MSRRSLFFIVAVMRTGLCAAIGWLALGDDATVLAAVALGPGAAAANPVKQIVKGMQEAQSRLKQGNTSGDTQKIQEQIVKDIDKLIDASQQSGSSGGSQNSSSSGKQSPNKSSRQQPNPGENESSQGGDQPAGANAASKTGAGKIPGRGSAPKRAVNKASLPGAGQPLLREVWGHLPPALRENVRGDFSESVLPAYDELVRRYFEALLDQAPGKTARPPLAPLVLPPTKPPTSSGVTPKAG